MNVLVIGCGKIGAEIVSALVKEGHNVTAMDINQKVIDEIINVYDVMAVTGNGADCETLAEAGVDNQELVIAATDSDELNMLSCFLAGKMGARHTIARIRKPEYNDASLSFMKQQLGLAMAINPELLAAEEINRILRLPSAVKIETFSRRNFEMVELILKSDSPLIGMQLMDIKSKYKGMFLICVVHRGDEVFIPGGRFVLKEGDRIGLTAAPGEIARLLKSMGVLQKQARSVMILGGSRTAHYLALLLTNSGISVKIIEQDRELCRELCDAIPKAVVLQGDGAQQELLLEEGIKDQDAFVALTGMDEENILTSIFADSLEVPKVISKINRDELAVMAEKLGLECVVSPKKIIADIIIRYARALSNSLGSNVETLYNLMDGKAEAVEFMVRTELPWLKTPIKDLKFKEGILIAGIIRDRKAIIPSGSDVILLGDRVVVIAANMRLTDIKDIMQ